MSLDYLCGYYWCVELIVTYIVINYLLQCFIAYGYPQKIIWFKVRLTCLIMLIFLPTTACIGTFKWEIIMDSRRNFSLLYVIWNLVSYRTYILYYWKFILFYWKSIFYTGQKILFVRFLKLEKNLFTGKKEFFTGRLNCRLR